MAIQTTCWFLFFVLARPGGSALWSGNFPGGQAFFRGAPLVLLSFYYNILLVQIIQEVGTTYPGIQ